MAKTYTDETGKPIARLSVLARYFRKSDETLQDFQAQVKALDEPSKEELADGAAKELGYTVVATA